MKKNIMDFICSLEGFRIRFREIHWSTDNNATHLLCDDIMSTLLDYEDEIAEGSMGMLDTKIKVGDLMPLLPNATRLSAILKELRSETIIFKKELTNDEATGIVNLLDELIHKANKWLYRATQL